LLPLIVLRASCHHQLCPSLRSMWSAGRESLSLSSRGSYSVEWRRSGDGSESSNQQDSCSDSCLSRSHSLEGWLCPPLPGQVAEEPSETSRGRTARSAMESSPVNKSSTGETEIRLASVKCIERDFAISSF